MKKLVSTILLSATTLASAQSTVSRLCEELPINGTVRVNVPPTRNNPLPQNYGLRRTGEREYEVYVNVEFSATPSYTGPHRTKEQLNRYYKNSMRECFQNNEDELVDEFQRKIKLKVYEGPSSAFGEAPPVVKIDIVGDSARANAAAYPQSITCSTVIHEVLHLTGLSDEYPETALTYRGGDTREGQPAAFDCRPLGPRDSIMRDQVAALYHNGQGLYSGHVNMIIYPGCRQNNQRYMACVKFAYETSAANRNASSRWFDCATRIPDHCRTEDWVRISQ